MSYIPETLRQQVIERAGERCEYCHIHQQDSLYAHEVDHIIPPSAEGRVTVFVLKLNDEIRIRVRQALIEAGHYPRP